MMITVYEMVRFRSENGSEFKFWGSTVHRTLEEAVKLKKIDMKIDATLSPYYESLVVRYYIVPRKVKKTYIEFHAYTARKEV